MHSYSSGNGLWLTLSSSATFNLSLIDSSQSNGVIDTASKLKAFGSNKTWRYSIEQSKPLILISVPNTRLNTHIYPKVFIDIEVDEALIDQKGFPLKTLKLTLEIIDESNRHLVHRSHIDLATCNDQGRYQEGPIFHLQFGGKSSEKTSETGFLKLREPRWLHPPMDIILISEMLIANFYPEKWNELKKQDAWIALVTDSQKLCYKPFFDIANENFLKNSLLKSFWASNWDTDQK
ncbi:MAG: hypothetical protein ACMUIU_14800 [bacterium]